MGGLFLSKKYNNIYKKYKWACSKNHTWRDSFCNVYNGNWCPVCACKRVRYKNQSALLVMIAHILKTEFVENFRPDWLINPDTGRRLEIDGWFPAAGLAVEYDGEQHFRPIRFGKCTNQKLLKNFKTRQHLDILKNSLLSDAKKSGKIQCFLRFSCKDDVTVDFVKKVLSINNLI